MPVPSAIATALLGAGVTLASTFAPSLGLSVSQQRVGFAFGVLLMIVGAVLYFNRRTPERSNQLAPSVAISETGPSETPTTPMDVREDPVKRAIANALTELEAVRLRLEEAGKSGHLAVLPAHHHQPLADLFADRGWDRSRRTLDQAYNACDVLRHRLDAPGRRWEAGPMPEMKTPRVEESDDLPGVIMKVEAAITELRGRQGNGRERRGIETESSTVNVISNNQSGGITAHTVHMSQEPPSLESAIHEDHQFKNGYFITTVALDLTGYPKRMGLSAESAGSIHGLVLRREGSDTDLSDTRSRRTEGGGLIQSCGEPQPGRYIAEISTQSDMDRLHIETWLE